MKRLIIAIAILLVAFVALATTVVDPDGNVYTYESAQMNTAQLTKSDWEGNLLWKHTLQTTTNYGMSAGGIVAMDNFVYISGSFSAPTGKPARFGTLYMTSNPTRMTGFYAKIDASGQWLWLNRVESAGHGYAGLLTTDGVDIFLGGSFSTRLTPPGLSTITEWGGSDIFVAKIDAEGAWLWAKQLGGNGYDSGTGLAYDGHGNLWFTATCRDGKSIWHQFGDKKFSAPTAKYGSGFDAYIGQMSAATGEVLWVKSPNNNWVETIGFLAVDNLGNAWCGLGLTAYKQSTVDFGDERFTFVDKATYPDVVVAKVSRTAQEWSEIHSFATKGHDYLTGITIAPAGGAQVDGYAGSMLVIDGMSYPAGNYTVTLPD